MTNTISTRRFGLHAALFGLAATGIYFLMIFMTLAHIEVVSGVLPFDMRPGGYSLAQAQELLNGLGAAGRRFYLTRQIPLDLAYPALMALTLVSLLKWLGSRGANYRLAKLGIWLSFAAAIADYSENAGICMMILSWPDLSESLVLAASAASIVKAGLTTAAFSIVLLCFGFSAFKKMRRRP
ncbi:MAG: hypothetical protein AB8B94_12405 [Hyphomicrobiales bacterium]